MRRSCQSIESRFSMMSFIQNKVNNLVKPYPSINSWLFTQIHTVVYHVCIKSYAHTLFLGVQKYRCKYNDFKTFDDDNKSRTVGFHSLTSVAILPAVQLCVCRFCLYVGLCMTSVELSHVLYLSDPMVTCQNAPRTCTLTGYSTWPPSLLSCSRTLCAPGVAGISL